MRERKASFCLIFPYSLKHFPYTIMLFFVSSEFFSPYSMKLFPYSIKYFSIFGEAFHHILQIIFLFLVKLFLYPVMHSFVFCEAEGYISFL